MATLIEIDYREKYKPYAMLLNSGLLIRITAGWQIPILFVSAPRELAEIIINITRQTYTESAGPIAPRPRRKVDRNLLVAHKMLVQVPGIGPGRAKALLDHFGTVRNCLSAAVRELEKVEGIGRQTAEGFLDFTRG